MNLQNTELPIGIKELVLNALDRTFSKAKSHVEKSQNSYKGNLNAGGQKLLIDFIIQLLIEIGAIKNEEQIKVRTELEILLQRYKNSKGES